MKPTYYKRLFKKYGLMPSRGTYLHRRNALDDGFAGSDDKSCVGCAIGLRFVHAMKSLDAALPKSVHMAYYGDMLRKLCNEGGMPEQFAKGLDSGWESYEGHNYHRGEDADYDAGFVEGRAAAVACLGEAK